MIAVDPHPLLDLRAFTTVFALPVGEQPSPEWLQSLLRLDADAPFTRNDALKDAGRALLRHGGFKPAGRSKPASEYLVAAAEKGALGSINAAVDACNVVSLHGGLPISVVDLDRARGPFRVGIATKQTYVFNASGQEIDIEGLLCLFDADGPCANAVKDSQRTKTHAGTTRTLSVIWGSLEAIDRAQAMMAWYRELLARLGATTEPA